MDARGARRARRSGLRGRRIARVRCPGHTPASNCPQDWQAEKRKWRLKEEDFDLKKLNNQIAKFCESNKIQYIDLLDGFKNETLDQHQQLYLPGGDMHFNEKGNKLAAEITAEAMNNFSKMESSK